MYCNKCGSELIDNAKFCTNCGEKMNNETENKAIRKKCCICGNEIQRDDAPILFVGQNGDYKEMCDVCVKHMDAIEKFEYEKDVSIAVNYFNSKRQNIDDIEVLKVIKDIVGKNGHYINSDDINSDDSDRREVNEVRNTYKTVRSIKMPKNNSGVWIQGLKIVVWLVFISIIIAGICFGVAQGGGLGFVLFLAFAVIAFLSVAGIMVLLGAAEDIRAIRIDLLQKESK